MMADAGEEWYLRRAVVTSQVICDVTDVYYDAKKTSGS